MCIPNIGSSTTVLQENIDTQFPFFLETGVEDSERILVTSNGFVRIGEGQCYSNKLGGTVVDCMSLVRPKARPCDPLPGCLIEVDNIPLYDYPLFKDKQTVVVHQATYKHVDANVPVSASMMFMISSILMFSLLAVKKKLTRM